MTELKLIQAIWKYAAIAAIATTILSPNKLIGALIITGATISTVSLSPRNKQLEERVKNLEELVSK